MSLPRFCPGPLSRREFAKTLSVMLGGVYLHDVAPLRAMAARADRGDSDTAVILIWLPGGPPHLDMYDMKPEAPREYRGEFRPIPTVVPGLELCELMPWHAKTADRFCLIRSVSHEFADHGGGHKRFLTGRTAERADRLRQRLSGRRFDRGQDAGAKARRGAELHFGDRSRPQRSGRVQFRGGLPRAVVHAV